MTREEMLAIEPGKDLDALIAEKIMDYKIGFLSDYGFKKEFERKVIALPDGRYDNINCYSTNMSAAWEVVDKLAKDYYQVEISVVEGISVCNIWRSDILLIATHEGYFAPEVICKAALLAVLDL